MNTGVPDSLDFYVRLTADELLATPLAHLESAVDTDDGGDAPSRLGEAARLLPCIRGYTEWVGQGRPNVSVGWDWTLTGQEELTLDPHSLRTNVMLIDEHGVDCGQQRTAAAIIRAISACGWQAVVLAALRDAG
jgi:hypothetical protein